MNEENLQNQSVCVIRYIQQNSTVKTVQNLKQSLASSLGPISRTKIIASFQHEEIKYGSSSTLLFNSALVDDDLEIIKLIISCAKEHLKTHYDFGLYCAILSLSLVEHGLCLEISSCLVAQCYRHFLKIISSHIKSNPDEIVKNVDVSRAGDLLKIIGCTLLSKPGLFLNDACDYLSFILLQAYLKCFSNDYKNSRITWPSLIFLNNANYKESKLYEGCLLDLHHYSRQEIDNLLKHDIKEKAFIVLLNVSLTVDDFAKCSFENLECVTTSVKKAILNKMEEYALLLRKSNVLVVFNQKIISEQIKYSFQKHSIVVIDRIGLDQMKNLKHVSSAKVISSLNEDIDKCKSCIDTLTIVKIGCKSYVHVKNHEANFCSAVVCCPNSSTIADLKHVCWAAINVIDNVLQTELVLIGGARFEQYLIDYVRVNCILNKELCERLACSSAQFDTCLNSFCFCLEFMKNLTPLCISSETVYDCYQSKLNAFHVAIQSACIALEVKYHICVE